jgi:hypothetical protein
VRFGFRSWRWIGRRIALVDGAGLHLGAGPGSTMRLGVLRRYMMVDGYSPEGVGVGCLAKWPPPLRRRVLSTPPASARRLKFRRRARPTLLGKRIDTCRSSIYSRSQNETNRSYRQKIDTCSVPKISIDGQCDVPDQRSKPVCKTVIGLPPRLTGSRPHAKALERIVHRQSAALASTSHRRHCKQRRRLTGFAGTAHRFRNHQCVVMSKEDPPFCLAAGHGVHGRLL